MKKFLFQIALSLGVLITQQAVAQINTSPINILQSDEDFKYDHYYQVVENQNSSRINLLKLKNIDATFPLPTVPYKRDLHFGGWLRDTSDGTCLNTRGKVLVRDSLSNVTYSANGCTIEKGEWDDPYTARMHYESRDIQIDHVVALKNAYMSGAHEWDFNKRCLYANYLGNKFHLLSVNGRENLKKSDHTPQGYVPPNKAFVCEFIKDWLNIKLIWSLRLTPKEADAIESIAQNNKCDPGAFVITEADLRAQRDFMASNANLCATTTATIEKFK